MANTKPYVALACFCEHVLEDKDDVLSAVRIVDTYVLPPLPKGVEVPPDALRGLIVLKGLISLKSVDVVGPGTLRLIMHTVAGKQVPISPEGGWPVELKGGEHGVNLKLQIPLGVKNFGLIWFDVLWGEEILTRIPLRLKQGEMVDETPAPS